MTDTETKAPVTDSRDAGFNPEVEQSHAEAAEAASKAKGSAATQPIELKHKRGIVQIVRDFMHEVTMLHGNPAHLKKLHDELDDKLKE